MEKEYKYHKVDVVVASGTTGPTTTTTKFALDREFDTIEGVQAIVSSTGGIPTFSVGFSDINKSYVDLVDQKMWDNTRTGVKPDEQFLDVNASLHTGDYYIKTGFATTLTSDIVYQFVLRLSKKINN